MNVDMYKGSQSYRKYSELICASFVPLIKSELFEHSDDILLLQQCIFKINNHIVVQTLFGYICTCTSREVVFDLILY